MIEAGNAVEGDVIVSILLRNIIFYLEFLGHIVEVCQK